MANNRLPDSFDIVEAIRLLDKRLSRLEETIAKRNATEPEPTRTRVRHIHTQEKAQ